MDYQMIFCGTRSAKERYCLEPLVQANNYDIIWSTARPEFCHRPNHDFQYSLFRATNGCYVDAKTMFGVCGSMFDFILPQGILLTKVRELITDRKMLCEQDSFASKPTPHVTTIESEGSDDQRSNKMQCVSYWNTYLNNFNKLNRRELKRMLIEAHKEHTITPK